MSNDTSHDLFCFVLFVALYLKILLYVSPSARGFVSVTTRLLVLYI